MFMKKLKEVFQPTVTVAEIHKEFDTASEVFLQQIKEILEDTNESDVDNANELKKLGFRKSGNVKKYDNLIESTQEAEQAKKYIEDYATRYTGKFITEKMVEIICKKYGLVLGDVSDFIGEIPVKNAKEIIAFSKIFKRKDLRTSYYSSFGASSAAFIMPYLQRTYDNIPTYSPQSDLYDLEAVQRIKQQQAQAMQRQIANQEQDRKEEEERTVTPTFMVVGTLDQFDMNKKKVDSQYRIVSDIPDPVVLAQVNGGYLIVSKWGAEADIQEFHNDNEN